MSWSQYNNDIFLAFVFDFLTENDCIACAHVRNHSSDLYCFIRQPVIIKWITKENHHFIHGPIFGFGLIWFESKVIFSAWIDFFYSPFFTFLLWFCLPHVKQDHTATLKYLRGLASTIFDVSSIVPNKIMNEIKAYHKLYCLFSDSTLLSSVKRFSAIASQANRLFCANINIVWPKFISRLLWMVIVLQ